MKQTYFMLPINNLSSFLDVYDPFQPEGKRMKEYFSESPALQEGNKDIYIPYILIIDQYKLVNLIKTFYIFSGQIIHIRVSFSEFHFIHPLPCIPMQECFPPKHSSKLFPYFIKHPNNSN